MNDFYKILELNEGASQDDIRAAYRRLAKLHHPDLNQGDAASEAKFKQINEAHDTLGDPSKRAQYDQQRQFGHSAGQHFQGGFPGGFPGGMHFNFGMGGQPFEDVFSQFFGAQGFARQAQPRNNDFQFNMNISLEEAFTGKTVPVNFEANGQQRNISVNIPAGVENGTKLRFQGHGDRAIASAAPGDLYIIIGINEHPKFRRDGPHLHMNLNVDAFSAMIGEEVEIVNIDGQKTLVKVPAGTQPNAVLRVSGRGMPLHNHARSRGDLFINVTITIPRNLNLDQLKQIESIKQSRR